jgi:hypothetical protein
MGASVGFSGTITLCGLEEGGGNPSPEPTLQEQGAMAGKKKAASAAAAKAHAAEAEADASKSTKLVVSFVAMVFVGLGNKSEWGGDDGRKR